MTSQSKQIVMTPDQRADYGFARVRDAAYDAVMDLWRRRKAEGMTQSQLADALGGDTGWLSRNLRGPGNWTLRTVGRFVEALNGEIELKIHGLEDPLSAPPNYHAYIGYEAQTATDPAAPFGLPSSGITAAKPYVRKGRPVAASLIS
ncbi:MAG: helix-turn-helix domain-containing protein [Nitrobacter sp.]|uniref:helix-turn-helix domain-containing protein n=1 Tax=Nitrobacter sp. TaxID=29420 RepID=UPI00260B61F0|nr:helix-turn-helix transcriptional regulator [Nitrobacter sp.]MCV0385646.1 helix-turn-helix domain-containing protein [Nitrobacter sp.]